jgi:hypothetical protein
MYTSPIDQLRNLTTSNTTGKDSRSSNHISGGISLDDYEKIETNGRIVYRKRVKIE